MSQEVQRALFFTLAALAALLFLVLFLYPPFLRLYRKRHTVRSYYKAVNRLVLDNDFYLINAFHSNTPVEGEFHIDHIVFGEKYIYVLQDRYYAGAVLGKENDEKWNYYRGKKRKLIDNPMPFNEQRRQKLALLTGIPLSYFIGITVINDDCLIVPFAPSTDHSYLLSLSKLQKFIEQTEREEGEDPLDPDALSTAVRDIASLNQHD